MTGKSHLQKEAATETPKVEGEGRWTGRRLLSATWTEIQTAGKVNPEQSEFKSNSEDTVQKILRLCNCMFAVNTGRKEPS